MVRHPITHEQASDDLPMFLLGGLDQDEADAVARHLASCAQCQRERARLEQLFGQLGTAVPQVKPPDDLRDRILSQLGTSDNGDSGPVPIDAKDEAPRRIPAGPRWWRVSFAVAASVILALSIWVASLRDQLSDTQNELQTLQVRISERQEILAETTRMIQMISDTAPDAYGTLYVGAEENQALLVVEKLPPTPTGKLYQIWLVQGEQRTSAGLFSVGQAGDAEVVIQAPAPLTNYQALGITAEPAPNGSPGPTGPRVIGCQLP